VPAHHVGRDFIADQISEDGGVLPTVAHSGEHGFPDLFLGLAAVEKCNVLRPRKPDQELQTHLLGSVEQPDRRHGEDPHGVDTGFSHQREIGIDHSRFRELGAMTALWEGAIRDPLDEVFSFSNKKELALNADRPGGAGFRQTLRRGLRRNLFGFDQGHIGSSRGAGRGSPAAGGPALA